MLFSLVMYRLKSKDLSAVMLHFLSRLLADLHILKGVHGASFLEAAKLTCLLQDSRVGMETMAQIPCTL
jgi:hypothetical protein